MSKQDYKTIWHTPSLKFSEPRTEDLSTVVISHTVNCDVESALSKWSKVGTSVNMFIREDGTTLLYYDGDRVTFMCGNGVWHDHGRGADGIPLNKITFNIMLVGNGCEKPFAAVQIENLINVLVSLQEIYGPLDVQGLGDVNPHPYIVDGIVKGGNHVAPGYFFDWKLLAEKGFGKYVDIRSEEDLALYKFGDTGLTNIQKALYSLGYNIKITDNYDEQTSEVARAFLNHYREGNYNEEGGMENKMFSTSGAVVLSKLTEGKFDPLYGDSVNQELYDAFNERSTLINFPDNSNLVGHTATIDNALENAEIIH